MATTRVYILAQELGVKSSAIVKKCQDEGLDVQNHMATISAGLAATIREWFSEGENVTTIETSAKVDLKRVQIRKKPKREKAEETKTPTQALQAAAQEQVQEKTPVIETAAAEELATEIDETIVAVRAEPAAKPVPQIEEPKPILPAGPKLERPKPAELTGPQVVRFEAPEPVVERPRPRAKPRGRYDTPITEPLMRPVKKEDNEQSTEKLPPASERTKERTHGRRRDHSTDEPVRKTKQRAKWRQRDIEERQARLVAADGEGFRSRPSRKIMSKSGPEGLVTVSKPQKVTVSEPIIVKDLSAALGVKSGEIISKLMSQGLMATANQAISSGLAELVALEFGIELSVERKHTLEEKIVEEFEQRPREHLRKRPTVATMLGHVDHGKTSLLDRIRSTNVTGSEAGGITQHIGAYQVGWDSHKVTFLDTPGHAAFTALRARGANMTDVVVLVVAADDGVMPQTVEVINHAKAAGVSVIVALNKIDLPGCDINRIYSQLSEYDLAPAEWGGRTEVVKTSAVTGEGIADLLEHIDYVSELLELKADDTIPATGWVVEAEMSAQLGASATLLIKEGQLKKGDVILAGGAFGRVKALRDSFGKHVKVATSSMPVKVTGLSDVPAAGDKFYCLGDINKAKAAAQENQMLLRERALAKRTQVTLDNLFSQIEAGSVKELNLVVRADVQGSVDVLTKYLSEMSTDEVKVRILHAATGGITEGDVVLAEASNAIIIGFSVVAEEHVARLAEQRGVEIRLYTVIYRITEDLEKSMVGLLEPEEQEKSLGKAVVRETFRVSRVGTIAGCFVNDGVVTKNARARLVRDNVVVCDDLEIESLKHFKDDAREVKAGLECGIKVARHDDIKVGDILDFYEVVKVARTL